jgi:hypothetical protein
MARPRHLHVETTDRRTNWSVLAATAVIDRKNPAVFKSRGLEMTRFDGLFSDERTE